MVRGQDYSKGWVAPSELFRVSPQVEEPFKNARVKAGDVVITIVGASTGHIEMIPDWLDGANLTQTTARLAINPSKAFSGFCKCYLQSSAGQRQVANYLKGAAQPGLNCGDIERFRIPLPPTNDEQRSIATALSDVDALLGALDRLIAKKRGLKQASMQQLLTGQTRLPGFRGEWKMKRLEDVLIRLANGALYQPSNSTGLPVTRIETIADGTIDMSRVGYGVRTSELEEYRMLCGDILFSHINSVDHIGKVAIYSGEPPLYHGMNLLLLRVGSLLNSQFLFYWLGSYKGRNKAVSLARQAVSQASINTSDLKRVEIPLPTLPEQTAIAEVLTDMDAELVTLEQRRNKTRAVKQAMMQELLTGKTRLISPEEVHA